MSCFPPADSAWRSICCRRSLADPEAARNTCGFWSWRPKTARSKWTKCCVFCWREARKKSVPRGSRPCWESSAVRLSAMCKWPQSTSACLTSCTVRGRCCNEHGPSDQNGIAGEPERTAPARDARLFRTDRATSRERNPQLRAIPAGVGGTGVRGPATYPHREVAARVGATTREDVGQLRAEALADQGRA